MKELDLTQRLPVISVARPGAASTSGRQTRTFALLDARGFSDAATLGDLLACIAALPAETRVGFLSALFSRLPASELAMLAPWRDDFTERASQAESALSAMTTQRDVLNEKLNEYIDKCREADARAVKAERERDAARSFGMMDQPWDIRSVVEHLADCADILLRHHNWTGDGWERIHHARDAARKALASDYADEDTAPALKRRVRELEAEVERLKAEPEALEAAEEAVASVDSTSAPQIIEALAAIRKLKVK